MNRIKCLGTLIALLTATMLVAQSGISFASENWNDLLVRAQKENRLIFLDAYASWCGPCKRMEAEVFPVPEVSSFFNANFINAHIDMESAEGEILSQRYKVYSLPTWLFINGQGEVVHRAVGYLEAPSFLALAETALNPDKNMAAMFRRFANGERNSAFLLELAMLSQEASDPRGRSVAEAYLKEQKDWSTPEAMAMIYDFLDNTDSPWYTYLIEHQEEFANYIGFSEVQDKIQTLIMGTAFGEGKSEEASLAKLKELYQETYPDVADLLFAQFRMNYFQYLKQNDNYAEAAIDYFQLLGEDADATELNNAAWFFFENIENKAHLQKALRWAQQSVAKESQYFNTDTLAWLYFKLGQPKEAKAAAVKAIAIAKQEGEDYSSTQELLNQLK